MPGISHEPAGNSDRSAPAWIDNHCHLDPSGDNSEIFDDARVAGVVAMVTVGTDLSSSKSAVDFASSRPGVFATAGVHPHDAKDGVKGLADLIESQVAVGGTLVAVGECGLDYHYDHSPRDSQRRCFAEQIRLAHEFDLPLVIHTRSAWDDTLQILDSESVPRRTVFHCFTGGPDEAEKCLERGALLSISGIVTFPSADDVRAAVRITPLDRLMVETDSPYLSPVPFRGKPNTPARVAVVGAAVADVLELEVDEVSRVTTATTVDFYELDTTMAP
ncbi:MAG: TatD family hydrolase [Microthrixaceae bacterium]|nr:TatD family hydrolase [Microthrixaceae bacterium]